MLQGRGFTPAQYADLLIDQFDEMRLLSRAALLVFLLSFHPYLNGHAFILKHIRRVIGHIALHNDIWPAHPSDFARYVQGLPDGIVACACRDSHAGSGDCVRRRRSAGQRFDLVSKPWQITPSRRSDDFAVPGHDPAAFDRRHRPTAKPPALER